MQSHKKAGKHPDKIAMVTVMLRWMILSHSLCSVRDLMFNSNIHYAHTFTLNLFKTKVLGTRYIFISLPMIETRFISLVFLAVEPTQLSYQLLVSQQIFSWTTRTNRNYSTPFVIHISRRFKNKCSRFRSQRFAKFLRQIWSAYSDLFRIIAISDCTRILKQYLR